MGIVAMINVDEGVKGRIGWERQLMDRCVDGAADAAGILSSTPSAENRFKKKTSPTSSLSI